MTTVFNDGILSIWDEVALENAETSIETSAVAQLHIGAKCYRALGLENLLNRVSIFRNIQLIYLADDYIHEYDKMVVREAFAKSFPGAKLKWTHDLLVDGMHGR